MSRFLQDLFSAYGDAHTLPLLLKVAVIIFIVTAVRSLGLMVPAYLVFWKFLRTRLHHRRIQQRFPAAFRMWNEFKWSLSTFVIFTILGIVMYLLFRDGYTRHYDRISDYGWPYFFVSVAIMILVHDAYFYWTHRLLHLKPLFRHVHRVHHESVNPSPWAAFSFHPVEAVIAFGIIPLIAFGMPFHVLAVKLFLVYMTALNVLGHLGYEIFPRGFTRHWLVRWHNTSTHHNMHHRRVHCNYGLYFNWWDRALGTNHEAYHETFEAVTSRPAPARGLPAKPVSDASHAGGYTASGAAPASGTGRSLPSA